MIVNIESGVMFMVIRLVRVEKIVRRNLVSQDPTTRSMILDMRGIGCIAQYGNTRTI